MTKAILFDFMGVLLFKRDNYVPDALIDEIDNIIGKVTNDEKFRRDVIETYGLSKDRFGEILCKIINKYERFSPIWNLLPELRKSYKLAIVNNGTALTLPVLKERYKIDDNFDLFISSAIEGIRKPDGGIYILTAKRLGVKPSECLFMDDSYKNIEGAKVVGMQTIWWENKDKGFEEFFKFLKLNNFND